MFLINNIVFYVFVYIILEKILKNILFMWVIFIVLLLDIV